MQPDSDICKLDHIAGSRRVGSGSSRQLFATILCFYCFIHIFVQGHSEGAMPGIVGSCSYSERNLFGLNQKLTATVELGQVGTAPPPAPVPRNRFLTAPSSNCDAPLRCRTTTVPGGSQVDSLFRISHTDPWVGGDVHRTSRTVNFQVCIAAHRHLGVLRTDDP